MDERLRHTDEETAAGREGIQAVRARLGAMRPVVVPRPPSKARETVELPQLEAEMAWGVEREQLQARIHDLEVEVLSLRRALGAILRHAADAVSDSANATEAQS